MTTPAAVSGSDTTAACNQTKTDSGLGESALITLG